MATEKVSEQAASISSIDMNNNKQVKLKSCYNDVSYKTGNTSNMAAQFKRNHAISLSDSSHNTVSSSKIPQHQSTSSAGNSLVSNTSQLKLHEFSSAKSKFSSNSQKSQTLPRLLLVT